MSTQVAPRTIKSIEGQGFTSAVKPYVSSTQNLPEITLKSFLLGVILSFVMASANAYLGLKIGFTVSATIPAAVISMAILRFFRNANILENNMVQTIASAGEVVAAGTMFTLPALVMMGYWKEFPFWNTMIIVGLGGVLGVLFSIPLRRALVVESELAFPEGIATAEVLKVGESKTTGGAKDLVLGGVSAAFLKFGQSALTIFSESIGKWFYVGGSVFGMSSGLSPVLLGAGFIVGESVGISMMIGGLFCFSIVLPIYALINGLPQADNAFDAVMMIWSSKLRLMGIGMMVVGGLWTIFHLIEPMKRAVRSSLAAFQKSGTNARILPPRTERDVPFPYVIWGTVVLSIPLAFISYKIFDSQSQSFTSLEFGGIIALVTAFTIAIGFLGSGIAGYLAGAVGSSNSPLSGITIMSVLFLSVIMLLLFPSDSVSPIKLSAFVIIIAAVVTCASAVSADNLQDLKAGQLVGATPWKQQAMLIVGAIVGAAVMAPVFNVLFQAYGIGDVFPVEGMDKSQALGAPKAAFMAVLAKGVFERSLDWTIVSFGAVSAVVVIIMDEFLKRKNTKFRLPILPVAIGVYMPLDVTTPVLIGGLISLYANRKLDRYRGQLGTKFEEVAESVKRRGVLFSSGLVAGEALMGILIASFLVSVPNFTNLKSYFMPSEILQTIMGTLVFLGICAYLYNISSMSKKTAV